MSPVPAPDVAFLHVHAAETAGFSPTLTRIRPHGNRRGVFRPTPLKLILGLVLVGATYMVAANSHMDIFPCKKTTEDNLTGRLSTSSSTCSLLQTGGDYYQPPEKAELTGAGYGTAVAVIGLLPLLVGFAIGSRFGRKK